MVGYTARHVHCDSATLTHGTLHEAIAAGGVEEMHFEQHVAQISHVHHGQVTRGRANDGADKLLSVRLDELCKVLLDRRHLCAHERTWELVLLLHIEKMKFSGCKWPSKK